MGLESTRGFHNPGVQGPFGAAAAVGKLYGFDAATLASALGLAGSCAAGLLEFAWSGDDTKRIHLGRASSMGLESALLARKGLHGPVTVIEGPYGYFNAFSEPTDIAKLTDGLGQEVAHPARVAQGVCDPRDAPGGGAGDPGPEARARIRSRSRSRASPSEARTASSRTVTPCAIPMTVMGGQYSLPFTAAVALTRDMSNPLVYNDAAVQDPLVRKLAKEMELIVDESVHDSFPAEVTIVCGDSTYSKTTSAHKGSPHNPLTWDDACEKFSRYTRTLMSEPHAPRRSWQRWTISRTRAIWRASPRLSRTPEVLSCKLKRRHSSRGAPIAGHKAGNVVGEHALGVVLRRIADHMPGVGDAPA